MDIIGKILLFALDIYLFIIIAHVVLSWLIAFEVINIRNAQAANLVRLLQRCVDPVMRPIQRFIPPIGGIDITPLIVIFAISILQSFIADTFIFH